MSAPGILRAGLFNPSKISGLTAWFAADRITGLTNGSAVSQWSDISGGGRHATQAATSKQPTYQTNVVNGRPSVKFNGGNSLRVDSVAASFSGTTQPHTLTMVIKTDVFNAYSCFFGASAASGTGVMQYKALTGGYYFYRTDDASGGNRVFNIGLPDTSWHIMTIRYSADTVDLWVDGAVVMDGNPIAAGAMTIARVAIAAGPNGASSESSYFQGQYAELAVYNRAATNQEIRQLHTYFSHKYEIYPVVNTEVPITTTPARYSAAQPIEVFPSITANKLADNYGFNIAGYRNQAWVFQKAVAAGAKEVRWQVGWSSVENMSGTLSLPAPDLQGLQYCAQYGLKPRIIAAYGPPYQSIGTFTVASNVAAGSYMIPVVEAVSSINPPFCFILQNSGSQITSQWSYYGSIVDSVDTANKILTLGSKTTVSLTAGTVLKINRLLYAPINSLNPNDPSVVAYCRYARFLADQIAALGIAGMVELWNEPTWPHDFWDVLAMFYDNSTSIATTANQQKMSPKHEPILQNLFATPRTDNVRYDHSGTHTTGGGGIIDFTTMPTQSQLDGSVTSQSIHPYQSSNLMGHGWYAGDYSTLKGGGSGSQFPGMIKNLEANRATIGPNFSVGITEVGVGDSTDHSHALFNMANFLCYSSLGLGPILFYLLVSTNTDAYRFIDTSQNVRMGFTAFADMATKLAGVRGTPNPSSATSLPVIQDYIGTYPLAVFPVLCAGKKIWWISFQRDYDTSWWWANKVITPASVILRIPSSATVVRAWDMLTTSAVTTTLVGGKFLKYSVTANPVVIEIDLP